MAHEAAAIKAFFFTGAATQVGHTQKAHSLNHEFRGFAPKGISRRLKGAVELIADLLRELIGHLVDQTTFLEHAVKVILNGRRHGYRC